MNEPIPRLAVTALTFSTDARESAQRAREAGFSGLLFDAYSTHLSLPDLSTTGKREFRHVLAAQQIELVGLSGEIGPKGFGPGADIDRLISGIDRAMDTAAGLASPLLCLDLGPLPEPPRVIRKQPTITEEQAGLLIIPTMTAKPSEPEPPRPPSPADIALADQVNAALSELGHRAEQYSVTLAYRSSLAGFAALQHAVAAARCPWFGVDLDPVAMLRDELSADEIFSSIGSLIRHVRIRDAVRGTDRRTQPAIVGRGSIDWSTLTNQLDAAGYHGWKTVDPIELVDRPAAAIAATKAFLSK